MPFYHATVRPDLLSEAERRRFAADVVDVHCDVTGAPPSFVHVLVTDDHDGVLTTRDFPPDQQHIFTEMLECLGGVESGQVSQEHFRAYLTWMALSEPFGLAAEDRGLPKPSRTLPGSARSSSPLIVQV